MQKFEGVFIGSQRRLHWALKALSLAYEDPFVQLPGFSSPVRKKYFPNWRKIFLQLATRLHLHCNGKWLSYVDVLRLNDFPDGILGDVARNVSTRWTRLRCRITSGRTREGSMYIILACPFSAHLIALIRGGKDYFRQIPRKIFSKKVGESLASLK